MPRASTGEISLAVEVMFGLIGGTAGPPWCGGAWGEEALHAIKRTGDVVRASDCTRVLVLVLEKTLCKTSGGGISPSRHKGVEHGSDGSGIKTPDGEQRIPPTSRCFANAFVTLGLATTTQSGENGGVKTQR